MNVCDIHLVCFKIICIQCYAECFDKEQNEIFGVGSLELPEEIEADYFWNDTWEFIEKL